MSIQHLVIADSTQTLMQEVVDTFRGVDIRIAEVHKSDELSILLDDLLSNGFLNQPVKPKRQGARGRRGARNFLLRQALWFARQYLGHTSVCIAREAILMGLARQFNNLLVALREADSCE